MFYLIPSAPVYLNLPKAEYLVTLKAMKIMLFNFQTISIENTSHNNFPPDLLYMYVCHIFISLNCCMWISNTFTILYSISP